MVNFGCFNSSIILFIFCNESAGKTIYHLRTFTAEPPSSPIKASTLLARPPHPLRA